MGTKGCADTWLIKSGHAYPARVWFRNSCPTRPTGLSYLQGWVLDLYTWGGGEIPWVFIWIVWDLGRFNAGMAGLERGGKLKGLLIWSDLIAKQP